MGEREIERGRKNVACFATSWLMDGFGSVKPVLLKIGLACDARCSRQISSRDHFCVLGHSYLSNKCINRFCFIKTILPLFGKDLKYKRWFPKNCASDN